MAPMPLPPPHLTTLRLSDGRYLACRQWAGDPDATPLILLHGLTQSAAAWHGVAGRLAGTRRVIAWDARGHGASSWAADAAYAGDAHFADLVDALDSLRIERCALAGFSMGGGVAILAAGALPERIARLIVVDAYPHPEMSAGSFHIAQSLAALAQQPGATLGFDPAIARAFAEQLAADDPRRLDLWPFWEAGEQPALVVRGTESTVLTVAMAAEMLRRRPSACLATVPNTGHAIPATHPDVLATLIEAFLTDTT